MERKRRAGNKRENSKRPVIKVRGKKEEGLHLGGGEGQTVPLYVGGKKKIFH